MVNKVSRISEERRKKTDSIAEAIKRAKQHIRNVGAEGLQEPEGVVSGDMNEFLEKFGSYDKKYDNK